MLIIFDLDDTLIDTSGSVTPFKMRECLKGWVASGLQVPDFEMAYAQLLAINAASHKSRDALAQFLALLGGNPSLLDSALIEMNEPLPPKRAKICGGR